MENKFKVECYGFGSVYHFASKSAAMKTFGELIQKVSGGRGISICERNEIGYKVLKCA